MTVFGIVGLDYCGSTLMNNIFSGFTNSVSVGESHWIVDRNLGCRECFKKPCPIFTKELLLELRSREHAPGEWWRIIKKHTGSNLIISSDKTPKMYDRLGIPDNILFLYKDPRANIYSWCKRKYKQEIKKNQGFTKKQIEDGIEWWKRNTNFIKKWIIKNNNKKIAVLKLEDFCEDPYSGMREISGWIGEEYDSTAINFWKKELHYIGGNHSVKRLSKDKFFFKKIKIDDRWKYEMTEENIKLIEEDMQIYSLIDEIFRIAEKSNSESFR